MSFTHLSNICRHTTCTPADIDGKLPVRTSPGSKATTRNYQDFCLDPRTSVEHGEVCSPVCILPDEQTPEGSGSSMAPLSKPVLGFDGAEQVQRAELLPNRVTCAIKTKSVEKDAPACAGTTHQPDTLALDPQPTHSAAPAIIWSSEC